MTFGNAIFPFNNCNDNDILTINNSDILTHTPNDIAVTFLIIKLVNRLSEPLI